MTTTLPLMSCCMFKGINPYQNYWTEGTTNGLQVGSYTFLKNEYLYRALMDFNIVSLGASVINSAILHLLVVMDGLAPNPTTINFTKCATSWNEKTVTWATQPALGAETVQYTFSDLNRAIWKEIDITDIAEAIRAGGLNGYGLMLKMNDEYLTGKISTPAKWCPRFYGVADGYVQPVVVAGLPARCDMAGQRAARLVVDYDV